jgi:hypothetical protein
MLFHFNLFIIVCICKYNQINKHLQDIILQCMISGELKRTNLFHYDEVVNDDKKEFEKTKISSIFYFFISSLDIFCFFFIH